MNAVPKKVIHVPGLYRDLPGNLIGTHGMLVCLQRQNECQKKWHKRQLYTIDMMSLVRQSFKKPKELSEIQYLNGALNNSPKYDLNDSPINRSIKHPSDSPNNNPNGSKLQLNQHTDRISTYRRKQQPQIRLK